MVNDDKDKFKHMDAWKKQKSTLVSSTDIFITNLRYLKCTFCLTLYKYCITECLTLIFKTKPTAVDIKRM